MQSDNPRSVADSRRAEQSDRLDIVKHRSQRRVKIIKQGISSSSFKLPLVAVIPINFISPSAVHTPDTHKLPGQTLTPMCLNRNDPMGPDTFWRFGTSRAPCHQMIDIQSLCPVLTPFWDRILHLDRDLTANDIPNSPSPTHLSLIPGSYKMFKHGLLHNFIKAAKTVIARRQKSPSPPTFSEWVGEMYMVSRMDCILATDMDKEEGFQET